MKLKINKACDLSSISVLPPQSRRSNVVASGLESSSIYGRSQLATSQMRSQQSQQSFSQGVSSQHGLFSQFSQNSQDDVLTNEKLGSQERENSVKRTSCLPPISYGRDDSQMVISRTSSNLMRKWSGPDHKCQTSEELEHRIGMVETSLNRLVMILDSVQSDVMQVNKGTKEVALEMNGMRQKLITHDDSLQLMNKGQEDLKSCLDMGLKSLSDQLNQNMNQDNFGEIFSMLSSLPEKIDRQMVKLQSVICKDITREMQAMAYSLMISKQKQVTPPINRPQAASCRATTQKVQCPNNAKIQAQKANVVPKVEMGGWTSVKQGANSKVRNINKMTNQKQPLPNDPERDWRIVIESDEEIDGFTCLFKGKGSEVDQKYLDEAEEETARILRKARRRKRKYCNTIIIN